MNIKAVVFDFDGTIRDTSIDYLKESTLKAIQKLRKKYKVYLATGRYMQILSFPGLNLEDFDGIICNNGACGYTPKKELLFQYTLADDQVKTIIEYCKKFDISLTVQTVKEVFSTPYINKYHQEAYDYFKDTPEDVKQYTDEDVLLMNAYYKQGFDWSELAELADIRVIEGPTTHVDLMLKGMDKYVGIKKMMELDGLDGEYIAFGDQENDYLMLKHAAIGIAVLDQYGSKRLLEVADYTCPGSGHDGIATILQQLELID